MSQSVIGLAGKNPGLHSSSLSWHLTSSNHASKPAHTFPLWPLLWNSDVQSVPSACARYLPLGVKTTHPHPILASRSPTTSNHALTSAHTLPLHKTPCPFDIQAVPIAPCARCLTLGVKTTHPHPIFASLSPTTSNHAFEQYEDLAKGDNEFTRMEVVNDQNN